MTTINAMSKFLCIPILLFVLVQTGYSQQRPMKEWVELGEQAYKEGNFPAAFKYYEAALKYKPERADSLKLLYHYAESARQFNAFAAAETAYRFIVDQKQTQLYPLSLYWLATVEQQQEKYEEAGLHFEQFLQQTPAPDATYQTLAQLGVENARLARDTAGLPKPANPTRLAGGINQSNAEYAAAFLSDTLIYSTLQKIYGKDSYKPPRKYTEIYKSVGGQAGKPWEAVNEPGKHVSNPVFNRDQTRMYYTICEYKKNSVIEVRCDLYLREKDRKGEWGEKKKLAINTPDTIHTTTQPALAFDAANKRDLLFFVSDRPLHAADTSKDLNIWCGIVNAAGEVGTAAPVDALNSEGNEASPAFYEPTQTLYFSSDRAKPNYGGFDVYEADLLSANNTWSPVRHLTRPINSGYDELHFLLKDSETGTDAYYSSNMPIDTVESTYVDPAMKACCWDIFQVDYEIKLLVRTFTMSNGNKLPLNDPKLSLYVETPTGDQLDTGGIKVAANAFFFNLLPNKRYKIVGTHSQFNYQQTNTIEPLRTEYIGRDTVYREFIFSPIQLLVNSFKRRDGSDLDSTQVIVTSAGDNNTVTGKRLDNNTLAFEVQQGKSYQITANRPGFYDETATADLTAPGYRDSARVVRNLYFRQELEVLVFASTGEPLDNATVERQRWNGSAWTKVETATNGTDDNSFNYDYTKFDMNERYRLVVSRSTYQTKTVDVAFNSRSPQNPNGKFNVRVELQAFQPIVLYFDNDIPGPSSRTNPVSNVAYGQTYEDYYRRKAEFIRFINTAKGYTDNERFTARETYDRIFERELRQRFQTLNELSRDILTQLQQGSSVEVTIEAFCSPLGSQQYNYTLSQRRINSILKHFLQYDGKKIVPFYNAKKFTIRPIANGESKADPIAQKALGSGRSGIFDIYATLERRVAITNVKITNPGLSSINYNLIKNTTK